MSTDNRAAVIEDFLQEIRVINQSGVDRVALSRIVALLENLAGRRDLFNFQHFPAPVPGQGSTAFRYRLNDDGDTPTLYLNSLLPGKSTLPHNHETWAIISAVEGEEINYVYTRHDEGREPGFTTLHLEREVIVQPGTSISFLGDDLHGIKVEGEQATLHFHLYGLPLESLDRRYGVDEQGRILNYNASQMVPSIKAY